jgi:superoxide dismutase, Cu-Zn family
LKHKIIVTFALSVLLIAGGCANKEKTLPVSGEKVKSVAAPILNTDGKEIGKVSFAEADDGVTISILAEGISPGVHGVHIHETGVCTPPDFTSAGAHLNPTDKEHGFENPKGFHLGDLPNIEVGEDGKVSAKVTTTEITLKKNAENTVLDSDGSALVIHEEADDYKTDPSGNSGDRIACAAITSK